MLAGVSVVDDGMTNVSNNEESIFSVKSFPLIAVIVPINPFACHIPYVQGINSLTAIPTIYVFTSVEEFPMATVMTIGLDLVASVTNKELGICITPGR